MQPSTIGTESGRHVASNFGEGLARCSSSEQQAPPAAPIVLSKASGRVNAAGAAVRHLHMPRGRGGISKLLRRKLAHVRHEIDGRGPARDGELRQRLPNVLKQPRHRPAQAADKLHARAQDAPVRVICLKEGTGDMRRREEGVIIRSDQRNCMVLAEHSESARASSMLTPEARKQALPY